MRFLLLRDMSGSPDVVLEGLNPDADMETLVARRAEFEKALVDYRQFLGQTLKACEVTRLAERTLDADLSNETNRLGLHFVASEWGVITALTTYRLMTHAKELSASLNDTLKVLENVLKANEEVLAAASVVLTDLDVDQQALPGALDGMENMRRQVDGTAQALCLIASRELESDAPTWKMALECADATRGFSLALAEIMKRARSAPAKPGSRTSASTGPAKADSSAGRTAASRAGDGMSGGGRKRSGRKGNQRPLRAESQVSAKGVSAPADKVSLALVGARLAMERSQPVTRQMAGGDPVEVARLLGQGTDTIDLFRRHHADPMHIAGTVRSFLPKWFGDIKQLRAALDKLAALPSEKRSDPDVKRLGAELTERISVLEAMPGKVTAREIEDIKQYQFPKEKHLERLLELEEIARVSRPMMLPSSGDDGGPNGSLFEMVITPKPLADGSSAPALYLHLHTAMPVTAQDVSGIPLKNFAAVHVKSAEQRRLGAKWVAMRNELGYDDTVHRGPIGSSLLSRLRVAAKASPGT
ncbi:MAG: hypothetical protein JF606_00750 [Burkholderiales bacterium]|nr:hypothetical protein [Burkholderiales bacterium]